MPNRGKHGQGDSIQRVGGWLWNDRSRYFQAIQADIISAVGKVRFEVDETMFNQLWQRKLMPKRTMMTPMPGVIMKVFFVCEELLVAGLDSAFFGCFHRTTGRTHDVISGIDVHDFAGDPAGHVRQ